MAAYCIVRVDVTDPTQYEEYKKRTPAVVAEFGGRFLARGSEAVTVEGPDEPRRVVVLEFPDVDTARACFDSPGYQEAKSYRIGAADMEAIIVDGVVPA